MLRRTALPALLACFAGLGAGACGSPPPQTIVLVTIDTLRADHLGAYGYPRPTSPFLDALAAEGVLFRRAVVPISMTVPSHASLFTSLYPPQLGVLKNGHRLPQSFTTLAERLHAGGVDTAGFVSHGAHFRPAGLDQGFAHFDAPPAEAGERPGRQTVDAAIDWLSRRQSAEPLFLWVHLFDPHRPYHPPAEHVRPLAARSAAERDELIRLFLDRHQVDLSFFDGQRDKLLGLMDAYDGEVRAADAALQRLHAFVATRGDGDATLWIVTSDHGEGLGNHRWLEHGKHIYNEQLRVPLIVAGPGIARGAVVEQLVQTVDVMPTVLALAEVAATDAASWQGASLVPLLTGDGAVPRRLAFAQRRHFDAGEARTGAQRLNFEPGDTWALQSEELKYLHRTAGTSELYDLAADPYETDNLAGRGRPEEERLRRQLLARVAAFRKAAPAPERVSRETVERLRALGYVQ